MKYILLLTLLITSFCKSFSQSTVGNLLGITSNVPANLTICGDAKTFSVNLNNPTPFSLQNGTVTIVMPIGTIYQAGSIVGATPISVTTNTLVFSIIDMASLTNINITYVAFVDCDIIPFLSSGNNPKNVITVNYTKSGTSYYDTHTTVNYVVKQPNLSITTVTNQSYTGAVGDVFTRCITIINGGLGELSQFTLTDVHAAGLQISAVSTGIWTNVGSNETIVLDGSHFSSVGDGDTKFETGESITICETITINDCIGASSNYKAFWGCNGKECQYSSISGNVVFPGLIPNITVVPNNGNQYANMNSCFGAGNASQQQLKIYNSGTGVAYNVGLDVYQATSTGGFQPYVGSYIDISSLTMQLFSTGAPSPLVPASTQTTNTLGCMPVNSIGQFSINIASIAPGDTVYVKWNTYSCCFNYCTGVGQTYFNGWAYQGGYENICKSSYPINANWGRVYSQGYIGMTNNNSTATMSDGEVGTFNFSFSSYGMHHNFPSSPSSQWFITYTVSPCLSYAGNFKVIGQDGVTTYALPNSVTTVGNVITATFNGAPPPSYALQGGGVSLDLMLTCGSCVVTNTANPNCGSTTTGGTSVSCEVTYVPNSSCACSIVLGCFSVPVVFNCPSSCPEGMIFKDFDVTRITLGLPDNEAGGGNGQADGAGALDFSKIRTDRAMFGDVFTSTYKGTIKTSVAFPSWQYAYAQSSISNGNYLSFDGATLMIYRGSTITPIATCNTFAPIITNSGATRTFNYDLSVAALGACLPGGFLYQNNDSVVFIPRYKVSSNPAGAILPCGFTTEYYVSPIPVPTICNDKYQCNTQGGNINIIGYYYENWNTEAFLASSCDNVYLYQNYAVQVGPWFAPYSNLFPFEYRNWDHIKTMQAVIPQGYEFIEATLYDYRNAGTNVGASSTVTLAPLSVATNTLVFNTQAQYQGFGGTLPLKDDGGYATLRIELRPSCSVTQDIKQPVVYTWTFEPITQLTGPGAYPTVIQTAYHSDTLRYDGPDLVLQSNLISVNVPNDTTGWTLNLSNNANVAAHNVWIAAPTISGVSAIRFYDLTTNTLLTPIGGIYQLGVFNAASSKNYLLVADFTSCSPDSIIAYAGWNCKNYPTSVAAYTCTPLKLTLKEVPLLPNLVTTAQGPNSNIPLCSEASYTVTVDNVQLGTAYTVSLTAILPVGVNIIPGTSMLSYPTANNLVSISDPIFVGGTQWLWNLSASNGTLNADGLKGVLEANLSKITLRFKVIAGCGYTSGSAINFQTKAFAACGAPTGDEVALSTNLSITGADTPYNTQIDMRTTFISPCNLTTPMQIAIHNQGPLATQSTDSVTLELPYGVSYVAGSFVGNTNAPLNTVPYQYMLNNKTYLLWKLPVGVAVGDSMVFTFNYQGDPLKLACVTSPFNASTIFKQSLVCVTGSTCDISVLTGTKLRNVFTYKAYLSVVGGSATSIPTATGELVNVNFTINNGGEAIQAGVPTTISYFSDTNNNGIYNVGDAFITNDVFTNSILNNGTYSYSAAINVPAGQACKIIAVLDTSLNHCSCTPTQVLLTPTLIVNSSNITLCSGSTNTVGLLSTTNYTYNWSPLTYLNNGTISNPLITPINLTASAESYTYSLILNRGGCLAYDTLVVLTNPKPTVTANSSTICVGQQTAALVATGATTYTWNTGETVATNNQSPATNSTYTVIGEDANGCKDTTTANVTVNSLPILSTTHSTICIGQQTATLTVNGATTYTWSTNENSTSIVNSPTVSTTYTVIGTDNNGCYSLSTASVLVNGLPNFAATTATICVGQQVATLVASGASTYTWSTLETTATVTQTPLVTTQYTVVGTDANNCYASITTTVTVNTLPTVVANSSTICIGQQTATLTASGANTYTWNTGETTASVTKTPILQTNYTVTATDINGCVNSTTATVVVNSTPTLSTTNATICVGQQIATLTVNGANTYTWSTLESTTAINVTPTTSTTYSVIGVNTNGCYNYTTASVLVNTLPNVTASNATICVGQQVATLNANGATTYTWSTLQTTSSVTQTPNTTTTYSVLGTNANGCVNIATATVLVNALPIIVINKPSICNGQTATLNATGANTYTWNTLQTTASISQTPSVTTTYTVLGVDLKTCYNVATTTITVYALPTASFTADSVCLNLATTLTDVSNGNGSPLTNYAWDLNNDNVSDATVSNTTHVFLNQGNNVVNYTVTSTPEVGLTCSHVIMKQVWVHPLPQPAFSFTNNCINAQPNSFNAFASVIVAGTNSLYAWNFGDSQTSISTNPITTHSYTSAGLYTATLTITSNKGCQQRVSQQIEVYAKPLAAILANSKVCLGTATTFTASTLANSGNITSWQWDVNNFIPSIETSGQNASYIFATPGAHTLTLLSITDRFCKDTIKLPVYVNYYPSPQFSINIPSGCSDVCVTFTDETPAMPAPGKVNSWAWNFGDGNSVVANTSANQTNCYQSPSSTQLAQYSATLTTKTDSGCVATITKPNIITVYPKPVASYVIVPDTADVVNPEVQFSNTSLNYTKWWWTFGDGTKIDSVTKTPYHYYDTEDPKTYSSMLIVSNQHGCKDTAYRTIEIVPKYVFYIPNAFSPTADGVNEVFTGVGMGITKYEMWLYDRWGEQIYYTDDINKGWNGKKQGKSEPCQQDVYVWKVEIKDIFGKKHNYVGHVTLLK